MKTDIGGCFSATSLNYEYLQCQKGSLGERCFVRCLSISYVREKGSERPFLMYAVLMLLWMSSGFMRHVKKYEVLSIAS
jgi:hypothetical protein